MDYRYVEQLIRARCRWLFNQEVQIITFWRDNPSHTQTVNYAIVLPKTCSLKSLVESNINQNILFKAQYGGPRGSRNNALGELWLMVQKKTNAILEGAPFDKELKIQKSELPRGYDYEPPRPPSPPPPPHPETIYEPSDFGTTFTPSISAMSDRTATPTPKADFEDLAELNRRMIQEEIDLAVKEVLFPCIDGSNAVREPRVAFEGLAGLNQRMIREEIDRALKEILAPPDPYVSTSKVVEYEGLAGLHRRTIRREVDLALRKVFGGL